MIYIVIPARSGSKSIVDKNLSLVGDKNLIEHTIDTAINISCGNRTIIFTTDSDQYIDMVKKISPQVHCVKRPKHLCIDTATDFDYLNHCRLKLQMGKDDIIVLLRPTTPLRRYSYVNNCITTFMKNHRKYDSLRSMHELPESPYKMFRIWSNKAIPYMNISIEDANKPKELFEKCYHPNGYCDIVKVSNLQNGCTFGENIFPYITEFTVEVDSKQELEYLNWLVSKR